MGSKSGYAKWDMSESFEHMNGTYERQCYIGVDIMATERLEERERGFEF